MTDIEDFASLDSAFYLPEAVSDARLRALYETLVARMRREAKGLPMNTVQQLLIERIAFNYVIIRHKENVAMGEAEGFLTANAQKDFNTFWLSMTQEFNRLLTKPSDEKTRAAMFSEVKDVILETLASVEDETVRLALVKKFADSFARNGM